MCKLCGDMAREIFPECNDEQIEFILWNLTAFPLISGDELRQSLLHVREIGIKAAIKEAEAAIKTAQQQILNERSNSGIA